jgi:hypothetical protein
MANPPVLKSIQLPSRGLYYEGAIPDGIVEIRKWTTADMAILANQAVPAADKMKRMIDVSVVLPNSFKPSSLLITDRFALLLYLRQHSLGTSKYKFDYQCAYCRKVARNQVVDIAESFDEITPPENATEPINIMLPDAGVTVSVRLLRGYDESEIASTVKRLSAHNHDGADLATIVTLCRRITHIDGEEKIFPDKEKFVRGLTALDSLTIANAVDAVESGIKTTLYPTCSACGAENEVELQEVFSSEFFRPTVL